ncbi:MAG: hypothetical protein COB15_02040 [Flavobacteriales bacterium]|nr:MAG: hypothetical protein COB15_02040 [Flavobacteriales bacterium]
MEEWKSPETLVLWITIIAGLLTVLLVFIVLLVRIIIKKIVKTKIAEAKAKLEHQQDLIKSSITTQEKERKRIASDLHDDLIGKLTVIKLQQEVSNSTDTASINLINECIKTARRISHDLSPPLLEYTPLPDLIYEIFEPWKTKLSINPFFDIRQNEDSHSSEFKIQLIRIIQEVITNIDKHANASEINVHYRQSNQSTILTIKDNGIGYNSANQKKGLGLKNIESRVHYLKGSYRMQSEINKGTSSIFLFKHQ